MDVYKGAVFPPNEADRMEAFSAIGLGTAPHDPMTARLCHLLSKLLQVHPGTIISCLPAMDRQKNLQTIASITCKG